MQYHGEEEETHALMLPQSKAVARPQANFGSWTQRSFKHLYPQNSFLLPENGLRRGGTKAPISHTALIDSYPWILLCTLSSGLVADVCLDSMWESMSICIPSCLNGRVMPEWGRGGGCAASAQPHASRCSAPWREAGEGTDRAWDKAPTTEKTREGKKSSPIDLSEKHNTEVSLRSENYALGFSRSM